MASFFDINTQSDPATKRYLQRDWSAFEKSFRENMTAFINAISISNNRANSEHLDPQGVTSACEKEPEKMEIFSSKSQEHACDNVEYPDVEGSKEETSAKQPVQPKEQYVSTPDAFEEWFGTPPTTPAQEEKAKPSLEIPQQLPAAQLTPKAEEDPFTQGFDFAKFAEIRKTADKLLDSKLDDVDLAQIDSEYKEYAIEYSVDAYRANADTIADNMAMVQAKKDRSNTILIQLTSLKERLRAAEDFYSSFGLMCSNASSKEKRLAQVMYHLKDFYIKLATVDRLHAMYEQVEKGLNRQIETLSRLLGVHLGKRPDFARPAADQDLYPVREMATPTPAPARVEPVHTTEPKARLVSKRGLEGLDDFAPNPVIPKEANYGSREVEF